MTMKPFQHYFLITALVLSLNAQADPALQSHESIHAVVSDFLTQHIGLTGEYEITLTPLDARLHLPLCAQPLEAYTQSDITHAGRVAVGVRCNAENKWSIFTSAIIKVYQNVVVLAHPVERGELITPQHLTIERKDVSSLREDFATQADEIENKQAARHLDVGTILSSRHAIIPKIIKRGDKVIITSAKPGFTIQMNGQAMTEGSKGQQIKVKNDNSGRIISATVIEPGQVAAND